MRRRGHALSLAAGLAAAALILYFSWTPDPAMSRIGWLPEDIGDWADRYVTLRTSVALAPTGVLLGVWLVLNRRSIKDWVLGGGCLLLLVTVAEVGQLATTRRVFDWKDIVWGAVGILLGMGAVGLGHTVWNCAGKRFFEKIGNIR